MLEPLPEGTVTILFTDTVGSTALAAEIGDRPARERLRVREALVSELVARHRGREVKSTGDGMMAAFTSARRAVDCAIDVQRGVERLNLARPSEAVQLRIGIHTGEVFPERGDLHGSTVNAAARIESLAPSGGVLVSEIVERLLATGSAYRLHDRGEFALKGFEAPWRLFEVEWREAPGARGFERSPLVGRERETGTLGQWLEQAALGRGALGLLNGAPGAGKSRLAQAALDEARARGFFAVVGHCREMEGTPPYNPFAEICEAAVRELPHDELEAALADDGAELEKLAPRLKEAFPNLPPVPQRPPMLERRFLLEAVARVIERLAARRPLLLVLEDLHWADPSTLVLLQHLAERGASWPVLLIGTYRDTELVADNPLTDTLPSLLRLTRAVDLRVHGLSREAVSDLLRAYGGRDAPRALVELVLGETEGNPFFVEQVLTHLTEEGRLFDESGAWRGDVRVREDEVPRGVRHVIGQRLKRVSADCRRALASAAIFGRAFSFERVRELAGVAEEPLLDALDEALAAHLVDGVPRAAGMRFSHELIRQTLLSELSPPRRQRLHLRAADIIETAAGEEVERHAADLAHHLLEAAPAADVARTVRFIEMAGRRAQAAAAFEDAYRLFDRALGLLDDEAGARAALLHARGLAASSLGRWDETESDWELALQCAERQGDGELAGSIAFDYSPHVAYTRRPREAYAISERGLAALGDSRTSVHALVRAYTAAGGDDLGYLDYETVLRELDAALTIARDVGDQGVAGEVLAWRAHTYWRHMLMSSCAEEYERALLLLDPRRNAAAVATSRAWLALALVALGKFAEAERCAEGLEQFCEHAGAFGPLFATRRARAFMDVTTTGNLPRWNEFAAADLAMLESLGSAWTANSHTCIALGRFWDGRWDEAWPHARRAVELALPDSWAGLDSVPLLLLHAYTGDTAAVRDLLARERKSLPVAERVGRSGGWELLPAAVEALAVIGDRAAAAALYPVARAGINDEARVRYMVKSLPETTAGIAAACAEDWATAHDHFAAAIAAADALPNVIEQADARRWHARACLDRAAPGDLERARKLLETALERYRQLGMPRHAGLALGMLETARA